MSLINIHRVVMFLTFLCLFPSWGFASFNCRAFFKNPPGKVAKSVSVGKFMYPKKFFRKKILELNQEVSRAYREEVLQSPLRIEAPGVEALIKDFGTFLFAQSHISLKRIQADDILVSIESVPYQDRIPSADLKLGILKINTKMIRLIENDSELAAIVGHEFLHYTLSHDLQALKERESFWLKWMLRRSNGDSFPLMRTPNFVRQILEAIVERRRDSREAEVDRALPELLINAGYNPWAIVRMYEKFLEQTKNAPPIFLDGYTRLKIKGRVERLKEAISQLQPQDTWHEGDSSLIHAIQKELQPNL